MFFTYIIQSQKTGKRYIGSCSDLTERLLRHNQGRVQSTSQGVPWQLIYKEEYKTRSEAVRRERVLKSYKGGEALKRVLTTGRSSDG